MKAQTVKLYGGVSPGFRQPVDKRCKEMWFDGEAAVRRLDPVMLRDAHYFFRKVRLPAQIPHMFHDRVAEGGDRGAARRDPPR